VRDQIKIFAEKELKTDKVLKSMTDFVT